MGRKGKSLEEVKRMAKIGVSSDEDCAHLTCEWAQRDKKGRRRNLEKNDTTQRKADFIQKLVIFDLIKTFIS